MIVASPLAISRWVQGFEDPVSWAAFVAGVLGVLVGWLVVAPYQRAKTEVGSRPPSSWRAPGQGAADAAAGTSVAFPPGSAAVRPGTPRAGHRPEHGGAVAARKWRSWIE